MRSIFTSILTIAFGATAMAQTTIANGGFENWGNPSPGVSAEPTGWYSNKSGSATAKLGGQTCFKDATIKHSGSFSVRTETISGPLSTVINGNVTTGCINAPSFNKNEGFIGSYNIDDQAGDIRRMSFVGRPDSIVGWYQYTPGGASEQGKVGFILHKDHYFDPETPVSGNHPVCTQNKIGYATFLTPMATVGTWTRFSVPVTYVDTNHPQYMMVNVTPSADQMTTTTGSKMWIDDLEAVYNPIVDTTDTSTAVRPIVTERNVKVFSNGKTVYVDFYTRDMGHSTMSIIDLGGRVVATFSLNNDNLNTLDLSMLNTGMYVYKIENKAGRKTGKFILE